MRQARPRWITAVTPPTGDAPRKAGSTVFVGCARDCAIYLPAVLSKVFSLAAGFSRSAFVFVTNDNTDATPDILAAAARTQADFTVLDLGNLTSQIPQRTLRLAECRNRYIDAVRAHYPDFDYLVVVDCDNTGGADVTPAGFAAGLYFLNYDPAIVGVFANQQGRYFDLWALRHPRRSPDDVWAAVGAYVATHGASDDAAFNAVFVPRMFVLPPDAVPLEVDSAFGGLGVYKLPAVLANAQRYVGSEVRGGQHWEICEHVSFNHGLREAGGRLFVMPEMINGVTPEVIAYDPTCWRRMAFEP